MSKQQKRLIIVTGLSGSGKTVVLDALEDYGYYCIDNLPVSLLPTFIELSREWELPIYQRLAVVIDARNPADALTVFPKILGNLKSKDVITELIFVDASDEILIKRFSETRRKHPLSTGGVSLWEAIHQERRLLDPLADMADLKIDTTRISIHQLRDRVREQVVKRPIATLSLQFLSFGFKRGIPYDADYVFDVRCLPNPHWEVNLRDQTGLDEDVIHYLKMAPIVKHMIQQICDFLDTWIPHYEAENRSYLTIAIGCTGGHHRSVFVVESLAAHFRELNKSVLISHRDL